MPHHDDLPEEYHAAYEDALALGDSRELYGAFAEIARDPDLFAKAAESGGELLRDYGVDVPGSLSVGFFEGKPNPLEWEPFRIVLTRCRTIKKLDRTKEPPVLQEATICLGISIVPTPVNPKG